MDLQTLKNRFGIIGNTPALNHALETAIRVSPTEMSVLIVGESGVGKEVFSKVIHQNSPRKHGPFIAVNCGAIPEGTIDSELFGHEKGSFTGATDARKGYFETANNGTIFLDEVGELPLGTQARLLRVLEMGEYIRVGASRVQKTNVRVLAATHRNLMDQVAKGKFREDLYYRLATVPIRVPRLNERKEDIYKLFLKFVNDYNEKYHSGFVELDNEAIQMLESYPWPGNVRQLRNVTEQICVLEPSGILGAETLQKYLPPVQESLPALIPGNNPESAGSSFTERDILYRFLFDLKKDVSELKKVVLGLIENATDTDAFLKENATAINSVFNREDFSHQAYQPVLHETKEKKSENEATTEPRTIKVEETRTLQDHEKELIIKSLERNKGKRRRAASELGISERTLYRKIKEYGLE
jgi:DNA-binding NtrC family response regulator